MVYEYFREGNSTPKDYKNRQNKKGCRQPFLLQQKQIKTYSPTTDTVMLAATSACKETLI